MWKLSLKWGVISGGIMTVLLVGSHLLFPMDDPAYFDTGEIYGYVSMIASLAVIYLALNDEHMATGTGATLWQKILVGSGAALVAGVIFGLYNVVYTSYVNPDFLDTYYGYYISQLPVQSGPEYDRMVAALEADKAMFMHPFTQFAVMGATVVMIGIPLSVALAFIHNLRTKP